MPVTRRGFHVLSSVALGAAPFRHLLAAQPPAAALETIRRNLGYTTAPGGTLGWLINKNGVVAAGVLNAAYDELSSRGQS